MVPRPDSPNDPLVSEFYAGKSIFITGGTGFMGKVLIERLLSTCPDVSRLYLLMRDKKGQHPNKRLQALKQSQVFDILRAKNPEQLDKLVAIAGDVSKSDLGFDSDILHLVREVSIVFHAAAVLKFDEPLQVAVEQNVRSVQRLLEFCDKLPNMEAFIHVSTAYCMSELSVVEERVYPPPYPLDNTFAVADSMPDQLLRKVDKEYIYPKPNTYTFTKAMAEVVVKEHRNKGYGIAIFRPTIVVSSLRDPVPGWIENLNGPSGFVVAAGKGLLHVFCYQPEAVADMLPVDIAIDTLITAAWETGIDRLDTVRVYNCSTCENPTKWKDFAAALAIHLRSSPLDQPYWYPCGFAVQSKFKQRLYETVLQTIPLHCLHYISKAFGIKLSRVSLIVVNQRLRAMNDVLRFFTIHEWYFKTDNVQKLRARLDPQDQMIYNLDPHSINWPEHYGNFVKGARKYLLKEKDEDLPTAQIRLKTMFLLHYTTVCFVITLLSRYALRNQHIRNIVNRTFRMLLLVITSLITRIKATSKVLA